MQILKYLKFDLVDIFEVLIVIQPHYKFLGHTGLLVRFIYLNMRLLLFLFLLVLFLLLLLSLFMLRLAILKL